MTVMAMVLLTQVHFGMHQWVLIYGQMILHSGLIPMEMVMVITAHKMRLTLIHSRII